MTTFTQYGTLLVKHSVEGMAGEFFGGRGEKGGGSGGLRGNLGSAGSFLD